MFDKSGKVISDQFEHLNMFFLSKNVNILVTTKNAFKAVKRKINLNFFDMTLG